MQFKSDALVLRAVDYGESDKIVTLFTADRGKLAANLKGVRKAGARLGFAAQPFCFAEYVLNEKSGRHTVVSASLYDGFYALRTDISAFYAAGAVAELCDRLMYEGMTNGRLFVAAVRALKELCEGEGNSALVRFFLFALKEAGYPVRAGECPICGKMPLGRMAFDMESGSFGCAQCLQGVPASETTFRAVRAALGEKDCAEETPDGSLRALRLLKAYLSHHTQARLPALDELLRL